MNKHLAGNTDAQDQATDRALAEGMVRVYFPNGTAFMCFESACERCRHCLDYRDGEPAHPKLEPPHGICQWGVLDRIYHSMFTNQYGYGTSFHHPTDITIEGGPAGYPVCKRFTPDDYGHDDRDPPVPDIPGQLTFGEIDIPAENPARRVAEPPTAPWPSQPATAQAHSLRDGRSSSGAQGGGS